MLDQEYVQSVLEYDADTGVFRWKTRPITSRQIASWNTRYAGKVAGSLQPNGYIYIGIRGRVIQAHRLAWLYVTGEWPPLTIDHKDCDKTNNAFANLRLATRSQQVANRPCRAKSGLKGTVQIRSGRWKAAIRWKGRNYYLGAYDTPEEAHAAYMAKAVEFHGEFARAA